MSKLAPILLLFCLFCYVLESKGSFIKGKNVPRVGRSNEADGPFGHSMGYVIKTIPSKNIPRMGRRNYDSENHFDIPKFYQLPLENSNFEETGQNGYNQEEIEDFYGNPVETMK